MKSVQKLIEQQMKDYWEELLWHALDENFILKTHAKRQRLEALKAEEEVGSVGSPLIAVSKVRVAHDRILVALALGRKALEISKAALDEDWAGFSKSLAAFDKIWAAYRGKEHVEDNGIQSR